MNIRIFLAALLVAQLSTLAGACANDPHKFLNGRYDIPKNLKTECGQVWESWTHDSFEIHHEHYAWLEMWSVGTTTDGGPAQVRTLILNAGYALDKSKVDGWQRIFGGATQHYKNSHGQTLLLQMFLIEGRLYVVMGGKVE